MLYGSHQLVTAVPQRTSDQCFTFALKRGKVVVRTIALPWRVCTGDGRDGTCSRARLDCSGCLGQTSRYSAGIFAHSSVHAFRCESIRASGYPGVHGDSMGLLYKTEDSDLAEWTYPAVRWPFGSPSTATVLAVVLVRNAGHSKSRPTESPA
jgi:hypothetical protein